MSSLPEMGVGGGGGGLSGILTDMVKMQKDKPSFYAEHIKHDHKIGCMYQLEVDVLKYI